MSQPLLPVYFFFFPYLCNRKFLGWGLRLLQTPFIILKLWGGYQCKNGSTGCWRWSFKSFVLRCSVEFQKRCGPHSLVQKTSVFHKLSEYFQKWSIWFSRAPRRAESIRRVGKEAGQARWLLVVDGCPTGWLPAADRMGRLAGRTQQRSCGRGRKVFVHCLGLCRKRIRIPNVQAKVSQALTPPLGCFPAESRACPWQETEFTASTESTCVFSSSKPWHSSQQHPKSRFQQRSATRKKPRDPISLCVSSPHIQRSKDI